MKTIYVDMRDVYKCKFTDNFMPPTCRLDIKLLFNLSLYLLSSRFVDKRLVGKIFVLILLFYF